MSTCRTRICRDELLALRHRLRALPPPARQRRAATVLSGPQHSALRGRGMDYLESRDYHPGDDIRHMDWRLTARSGRAHSKVFCEERERPMLLLVDLGRSMYFASCGVFKAVQAARVAALLGWSAVQRRERVGAVVYSGAQHSELPPRSGSRGALELIRILSTFAGDDTKDSGLAPALQRLRRVARPGSLVVLISDMLHFDASCRQHLLALRAHCQLRLCRITDPLDLQPPPPGRYRIGQPGSVGQWLATDHSDVRRVYEEVCLRQHQAIETLCRQCAMVHIELSVDEDPLDILSPLLGSAR